MGYDQANDPFCCDTCQVDAGVSVVASAVTVYVAGLFATAVALLEV